MAMIPWNSPSGPNSGSAVVSTVRLWPSRPVTRRPPLRKRDPSWHLLAVERFSVDSLGRQHAHPVVDRRLAALDEAPSRDLLRGLVEVHEIADRIRDVDRGREVRGQLARQDQDEALLLLHGHRSREAYVLARAAGCERFC